MISARDAQGIRDLFAQNLIGDVTITYFTQHESVLIVPGMECGACKQTHELLEEVASLSDHLVLVVKDFVTDRKAADTKLAW